MRLTKLKYTHIFIVDFHGSRIYQMKEKIMFFIVMYCCVNVAIQTGALPSKMRVVGSNPLPGTGSFFSSFLFLHFFPSFPYTARLPRCVCASVGRVLRVYLAGLLTTDFDHKHSSGRILGLW